MIPDELTTCVHTKLRPVRRRLRCCKRHTLGHNRREYLILASCILLAAILFVGAGTILRRSVHEHSHGTKSHMAGEIAVAIATGATALALCCGGIYRFYQTPLILGYSVTNGKGGWWQDVSSSENEDGATHGFVLDEDAAL